MGENLFYSQELYSWDVVISAWHDEVSHFKYPDISTTGQSIGHYTQVTDSDNVSTKTTDVLFDFFEENCYREPVHCGIGLVSETHIFHSVACGGLMVT